MSTFCVWTLSANTTAKSKTVYQCIVNTEGEVNVKQAEYWLRSLQTTCSLSFHYLRPTLYHSVNVYLHYNRRACPISWYALKVQRWQHSCRFKANFSSSLWNGYCLLWNRCRIFPALVVPNSLSIWAGNWLRSSVSSKVQNHMVISSCCHLFAFPALCFNQGYLLRQEFHPLIFMLQNSMQAHCGLTQCTGNSPETFFRFETPRILRHVGFPCCIPIFTTAFPFKQTCNKSRPTLHSGKRRTVLY